jgi:Tol biopolymer transport system component
MPIPADLNAICLVRPDGTGQHEVPLATTGDALHPDWSPDGKELAFVVGNEIWVAGVDGSGARSIASCSSDPCVALDYPAWSPDGSRIAFTRYNGPALANRPPPTSAVELVEVASRARTVVTDTKKLELVDQPRWSPDGRQLVLQIDRFSADGTEIGAAIATVSPSGGTSTPITDFSLFATYPDWNRISDTIVFTAHDVDPAATNVGLYTVRSDGSRLARITYPGSDSIRSVQPTWTPDGKHVLFVQWDSRQTAMVDADGSAIQQLGFKSSHPRLRPLP